VADGSGVRPVGVDVGNESEVDLYRVLDGVRSDEPSVLDTGTNQRSATSYSVEVV
jgi:hypothetical protein